MRIQRLDIQGFKSFADRVQIRFGQGVTGVVGPNGCGKSNIVDAIRWVMGEQSARHLRGGSMQDVIFNGSEKRGPMGMAEVTLTFENDGQGLPTEYQTFSEIQVTRRLFRDGESDYEINKTPCRLKDIHDLFLGTGVGKGAYSIIQQGQIAEIMRVKPEDRRRVIEEAAGITKYKARKDAAVRKMDATRQNLERISDVTGEISRRLGSLRRQAKKAEKYKELKAEAKEIELHHAVHKTLELTNAIAFDRDLYASLTANLTGDVDRVAQMETEIDARRESLLVDERTLGEQQARLYEIDNGVALGEQAAEHAKREHERSLKRDDEASVEVVSLKEQRAMLQGALDELKKGRHQLELEFQTDEGALDSAQADLDAHKQKRQGEAQQVESLRRHVIELSTEAAKAASDVVNLKSTLEDLKRRGDQLATERAPLVEEHSKAGAAKTQFDEERAQVEAQKSADEKARDELIGRIQQGKKQVDQATRIVAETKDLLQKKSSRLASLEEIHARYEQAPEAVRSLLKRGGPLEGRGRLLVDLFEAASAVELPIEAALGTKLQAVIVDDDDAAAAAIAFLKEGDKKNPRGRAELIVDNAVVAAPTLELEAARCALHDVKLGKHAGAAVQAVLGRIYVVDDLDSARLQWATAREHGITLVTLQGEVLAPTGIIQGGATAGADQGVLKQKREMRELALEVQRLEADLAEKQAALQKIAGETQELDHTLQETNGRLQAASLRLVEVKAGLRRATEELTRLEQRSERLRVDEEKIAAGTEKAQVDLVARQEKLHAAESGRAANEAELTQRSAALVEMDQTIAAQQEAVTTMKVRAASIAERRELLKKNFEQSEKQAADIEARLVRLQKQIEDGHGERAELTKQEQEARASIATLQSERVELKQSLDALRKTCEAATEAVRVLEHEARAARQALDAARGSHAGLQVRIRERELELDALVDRTIERHRITPFEVMTDYHMREIPTEEALEQLAELERQIESLGAINLTAIDECKELETRHDFLRTQADDLTHALNQLEKAIVKINRTTKKRFQETFEGINERFQQVFPRLFRGGKAWLALTDPNDMLATGVEIYAQPPGKKLGSVNLMSGGEQALTAVSLIFAIFLLKPSPFCVLDEVDAPLDEANVGRFNDMVRDISSLSQFIVITHNKRTMEVADQLYGITMEEAGISKTVNVRIQ